MKKILVFLSLATLTISCNINIKERASRESGDSQTFQKTIERHDDELVRTEISMNAGELKVHGGSRDLVDAEIKYTREAWKPEIYYSSNNARGKLVIEQPDSGFKNINFGDDDDNNWDISLNEDVKQDIYMKVGAGSTDIDLQGFLLNYFSLEAGVGEYDIDLSDTSVPDVEINAGVGEVNLNLTGDWKNNLKAEINGGIGELNLVLPSDIGVRLEVSGGLGSVDASGFRKDGNVYTNDAYNNARYVMDIEVNGGMGDVNVSLVN